MAESGSVIDNTSSRHVRLPLNSTRITAGQVRRLGLALGISVSDSINDQRLMVEGKLGDEGHDPCNFQVVFVEYSSEAAFVLWDEEGEFLTVPAAVPTTEVTPEVSEHESDRSREELRDEPDEVEALRQTVETVTIERDALQVQLQEVTEVLEKKQARIKELWRMSCGQVEEYDAMVVAKDNEIAALKAQLAAQKRHSTPSSDEDDNVNVSVVERRQMKDSRRGRAPPIDLFTGEDAAVRLDDWLPGLHLASRWNNWTSDEKLIQLAGHLRGRAEAEWNLLADDETRDFEKAVCNLREQLDPCSKVLAGQDFRRTVQLDSESVADYVCRLEKAFRVAFGNDKLGKETKETMLYGQLQEGLRLGILRSPSVSGAMSYKELCMAAKNEEQRQAELKKRQDYSKSHSGFPNKGKFDDRSSRDKSFKPSQGNRMQTGSGSQSSSNGSSGNPRFQQRCYLCNQLGHIAVGNRLYMQL